MNTSVLSFNALLAHLRMAFPQAIPEGHAVVILPLPVSSLSEDDENYLGARLSAPQITLHPTGPTYIHPPLSQSLGCGQFFPAYKDASISKKDNEKNKPVREKRTAHHTPLSLEEAKDLTEKMMSSVDRQHCVSTPLSTSYAAENPDQHLPDMPYPDHGKTRQCKADRLQRNNEPARQMPSSLRPSQFEVVRSATHSWLRSLLMNVQKIVVNLKRF